MKDIVIFGAGGLAREIVALIEDINRVTPVWRILGFVVSDTGQRGATIGRYCIVMSEEELSGKSVAVVIGIGDPASRERIAERFGRQPALSFPNLIHPSVQCEEERVTMGRGNVICAGNIFTTDIHIGSFNYLNLQCTYGHDVEIGDYCVFNPGINVSGAVKVESGCLIGTGATILQGLRIGDHATVGAGSVANKDVPAQTTVVGVPARAVALRRGFRMEIAERS